MLCSGTCERPTGRRAVSPGANRSNNGLASPGNRYVNRELERTNHTVFVMESTVTDATGNEGSSVRVRAPAREYCSRCPRPSMSHVDPSGACATEATELPPSSRDGETARSDEVTASTPPAPSSTRTWPSPAVAGRPSSQSSRTDTSGATVSIEMRSMPSGPANRDGGRVGTPEATKPTARAPKKSSTAPRPAATARRR